MRHFGSSPTSPPRPPCWPIRRALTPRLCRDPHDDYLVALATANATDAIVTGDLDVLAIDPKQLAIEIITPRQLVDRLS
jgi:predicted nucleic acid-binding protein